jgi:DNA mismatch repair protein MutS2
VGGLTITCREQEVRADSPARVKRRPARATPSSVSAADSAAPGARRPRSSIDLHGMTVLQSREALVAHIDAALRAGDDLVEVVHGIGTGRVRAAVHALLRQIPSVRRVQPHPTNRGVTLVHL